MPDVNRSKLSWDYLRVALCATLFPVGILFMELYQQKSTYSSDKSTYTVGGFKDLFYSGIFAYRPLGRELLLWMNKHLFNGELYHTWSVLNFVFLVALNLALVRALRRVRASTDVIVTSLFLIDLLASASLAVRTPYTIPVVFFILMAIECFESEQGLFAIVFTVLAALTHEVSAVVVVYALSRAWLVRNAKKWPALVAAVAWGATYVGLRLVIHPKAFIGTRLVVDAKTEGHGFYQRVVFLHNLEAPGLFVTISVLVLLFAWVSFSSWRTVVKRGYPQLAFAVGFAAPYALYTFVIASLAEFRLFLPFFPLLAVARVIADTPQVDEAP